MIESRGPWSTNSSPVIYEKFLIDSNFIYEAFSSPENQANYTQSLLGSLVSRVTLIKMILKQSFNQKLKQKLHDFLTWKD